MKLRSFWNNSPEKGTDYSAMGDATIPGQDQSVLEILKLYTSGVVVETKKPHFFGDVLVPQDFNGELSLVDKYELYERVNHDWFAGDTISEGNGVMASRAAEPSQSSSEHDGITSSPPTVHTNQTEG